MANSTIPNLPIFSGTPSGTEPMETVQSSLSVQIPSQKIADLATIVIPLTKTAMDGLVSASQVSSYKLYLITNADSSTRRLLVKGLTTTTLEDTAIDMSTGEVGTYVLSTDVFTPVAGGTPDLQQVTDVGATTTNSIIVDDGTNSVQIQPNQLKITNTIGYGTIGAANLTNTPNFELPDKAAGTFTFAMTSDIVANPMTTGGDIIYGGASGVPTRLANGTAGQVLQSNGTTLAPSWAAAVGGGDVYLANDQTFTGENTFAIGSGNDTPVTITKVGNNAGLKVTKSSGSGDAIEVAEGSVSIADETASTIAHFDGTKRIKSLATSTYPSLTELSYVKGVTSAIQTQINALKIEEVNLQDIGTALPASTYTIVLDAKYARTINELTVDAGAGTCTLTMNINGTPVTGISSVSVSTTEATYTATAANAIAVGDTVTIVTTSNSGLANLQITVKTTR
jgi:hypothetical protein